MSESPSRENDFSPSLLSTGLQEPGSLDSLDSLDSNDMSSPGVDPLIGTRLADRYEILSSIAHGGMGVVYCGRHILMDKIVAIKMLNSSYINEPNALARFQHEARVACRLVHPNIVVVHDFGITDEKALYLVMDFVEGRTVADVLDEKSCLPVSQVFKIAAQVCDALEYAHSQELIHRDLKPGNIMLVPGSDQEQVKILDFGLAKFIGEGKQQALSQTGYVFGTGFYMSPEQCKGKPADVRSEIYAIGCVLYECITGLPPFVGENILETCQKHIQETAVPMSQLRQDLVIPAEVEAIVTKALSKNPADRYQSAAELKLSLNSYLQSSSVVPQKALAPETFAPQAVKKIPSSIRSVGTLLAVCAVGVGSAVFYSSGSSHHTHLPLSIPARMNSMRNGQPTPDGIVESPVDIRTLNHPAEQAHSVVLNPSSATIALTANPAWDKYYADACAAFDQEHFGKAEKLLRRAVLDARHANDRARVLLSLKKLEDVLYVQQKFRDADSLNAEIQHLASGAAIRPGANIKLVSALSETKEPQDERIAHLAMTCHKNGQCDTAVSLLEHSIKITKKIYGSRSLQTSARMSELIKLYLALDEPNKAQPLIDEVMEIKAELAKSVNNNTSR